MTVYTMYMTNNVNVRDELMMNRRACIVVPKT